MISKELLEIVKKNAIITIICHPEHEQIRGNLVATGDPLLDRSIEDETIADINGGNKWGWCNVEVMAEIEGFEASEYLGCCSYSSEEQFKVDGYYQDMVNSVLEQIATQVLEMQKKMERLTG